MIYLLSICVVILTHTNYCSAVAVYADYNRCKSNAERLYEKEIVTDPHYAKCEKLDYYR